MSLPIEWEVGAAGATNSAQFRKEYLEALDQKGAVARHDGDVDAAMPTAAKVIEATYDVPIIAHAPMEPLNAIAHVQADRVDVWVGTQNADLALTFAAQASGVKPENVFIHNTFSGGGFGRRLGPDEVAQAVAVAKAVGKPVKLLWTREEEIRQGRYRTQAAIRFKAGFAADGTRDCARHAQLGGQFAILPTCATASTRRRCRAWSTRLTSCRTSGSSRSSRTRTCRSVRGARLAIRRTCSSWRASSTKWRMPSPRIP